jgi:hypothetical protein
MVHPERLPKIGIPVKFGKHDSLSLLQAQAERFYARDVGATTQPAEVEIQL